MHQAAGPEAAQATISDFSVSANKDPHTYDLSMQIKNGTTAWCITSMAFTYVFGDARGQEWTANEYPSVVNFKEKSNSPPSAKTVKASLLPEPASAQRRYASGQEPAPHRFQRV